MLKLIVKKIFTIFAKFFVYFDLCIQVTNAMRNSLKEQTSVQGEEGPMGIGLAVSPASSSYTISKTAITNASFRTKKLPGNIKLVWFT